MALTSTETVATAIVKTAELLHEGRREAGLETEPFPMQLKPKFAAAVVDYEAVIASLGVEVVASAIRAFSSSNLDSLIPSSWPRAALGEQALAELEPTIRRGPYATFERDHAARANLIRFGVATDRPGRAPGVVSGSIAKIGLVVDPSGTTTQLLITKTGRVIDHAVHQQMQSQSIDSSIDANGVITLTTVAYYLQTTSSNVHPAIRTLATKKQLAEFKSALIPTSWPQCPAAQKFFKQVTFVAPVPKTSAAAWNGRLDEVVDLSMGVTTTPGAPSTVTNRLDVDFTTAANGAMALNYSLVSSKVLDVDEGSLTAEAVVANVKNPDWSGRPIASSPTSSLAMFKLRGEKKIRFNSTYQPPPLAVVWAWSHGSQVFNEACV